MASNVPVSSSIDAAQTYLYQNYGRPHVVLVRGEGCFLWDEQGRRYLDWYAGVAVSTLGHGHPALVQAISDQAKSLIHASNYFYNEPNVRLAERLCQMSGMARAFFCNSGTEAIEALLKLTRHHFHLSGSPERTTIIAFENSFHGRTMGALAATWKPKYREGFGPIGGVIHVPWGDLQAAERAFGPDVAGVLLEPVQGEGGVHIADREFAAGLRRLCDERGALLLADEIQTGIGRTGSFLALSALGVRADAIALAKGLGGGVPIGAMLTTEKLAGALPPGSHGTTFGGNPLASAAALAVLGTLDGGLLEHVQEVGAYFGARLDELTEKFPSVLAHRGKGLLHALDLSASLPVGAVLERLRLAGLLAIPAGENSLRFAPPLIITQAQLDEGLSILAQVLSETP